MSKLEKSEKPQKVEPLCCPICGIGTNYTYRLVESSGNDALWYQCNCGVIFQEKEPSHSGYNKEYITNYKDYKYRYYAQIHAAKTYASVIEETTYGRRMLDVGFNLQDNMNFFRERGWIANGIDINKEVDKIGNTFIGKFEEFPFKDEYNLIWMSHVLEHFNNPLQAMKKAYDLLSEDGVLYIATPDVDFITKTGLSGFPHWKKDEHYILWNERALVRELERIGFNIILKKRNFCSRFVSWYDCHIIAQKRYY